MERMLQQYCSDKSLHPCSLYKPLPVPPPTSTCYSHRLARPARPASKQNPRPCRSVHAPAKQRPEASPMLRWRRWLPAGAASHEGAT